MVIKANNNNDNNNADATIDVVSIRNSIKDIASPTTTDTSNANDRIEMIKGYFSALDGKSDSWERYEPKMLRTIHPELVVESNDDEIHYDDFVALVRDKYIANGCIAELVDIYDNKDDTVTIVVNNHLPGEDGDNVTKQIVSFKDGKVVRVTSTAKFGAMLDRVSALEAPGRGADIDVVVERYRHFLEAFDGSSDVRKAIEPMFSNLFDEEFVFVTEEGNKDLEFFKFFVGSVAADGHRIRIESAEAIGLNKIHIEFYVIVEKGEGKGEQSIRVNRVATVQKGKVVLSEPVNAGDGAFTLVCNNPEK